jgi:hypothetical protein
MNGISQLQPYTQGLLMMETPGLEPGVLVLMMIKRPA